MINCGHLQSVDSEGITMILTDNLHASISRRRKDEVNRRLNFPI